MTDIKSTPATIARAMGWDFNQNTSLEALAAWEAYREIPLNTGTYTDERDAFTSGFDAATKGAQTRPDRIADALEALTTSTTAAAWIAWTTRAGHRPSGGQTEHIEKMLGMKSEAGL